MQSRALFSSVAFVDLEVKEEWFEIFFAKFLS